MATNGMIIEFGSPTPGLEMEQVMQNVGRIRAAYAGWKTEGLIDDAHDYLMVTGNRTERSFLIVLDLSHEQLEKLVAEKSWMEMTIFAMQSFQNFTTNRAIGMERIDNPPE